MPALAWARTIFWNAAIKFWPYLAQASGSQSLNGMIEPHFNTGTQIAGYKVTDFSGFGRLGGFHSKEGVLRLLWDKMIKEIEVRA